MNVIYIGIYAGILILLLTSFGLNLFSKKFFYKVRHIYWILALTTIIAIVIKVKTYNWSFIIIFLLGVMLFKFVSNYYGEEYHILNVNFNDFRELYFAQLNSNKESYTCEGDNCIVLDDYRIEYKELSDCQFSITFITEIDGNVFTNKSKGYFKDSIKEVVSTMDRKPLTKEELISKMKLWILVLLMLVYHVYR